MAAADGPGDPSASAAQPPAAGPPPAGRYRYDVTGTSNLGPVPAEASLTVEDLDQGRQRWTTDHRDDGGRGSVEVLTLAATPDGLALAGFRVDHVTGVGTVTLELVPDGDAVFLPRSLTAGQTWSFTARSPDGCAVARTTGTARAVSEATPAGGAVEPADVVHLATVVTWTGAPGCTAVDLRLDRTAWFGCEHRLPFRDERRLDGRYGAFSLRSETTAVIRSSTPT